MASKNTSRTGSTKWIALRRRTIAKWRRMNPDGEIYCVQCGVATLTSGDQYADDYLNLDHIKPVALYPELEYTQSNLQPMCRRDNLAKGKSETTSATGAGVQTTQYGFFDDFNRWNPTGRDW